MGRFGFTSTTLERGVAVDYAYSRKSSPILLEMKMGMIDRGADFAWLSQVCVLCVCAVCVPCVPSASAP